jgi:putative membrane protein
MKIKQLTVAGVTVLALGFLAAPPATLRAQTAASKSDSTFVAKAAAGGMEEVALGRLAQEKAASPQVKQFGQRMVTDHSKANKQLAQAAQESGIAIPPNADSKAQKEAAKLADKSGKDFDTAYMKMMLKDHEHDIKEFQKEASSGQAPAVKNTASETVPVLEQHLTMAKQVAGQVGVDTTGASGAAK